MKLIFLHGSGGCKESWHHQVRFFEDADAVDLPGHPEGEPCTSIDDYVEWLRGYIQEKAYTDVVLVGHSLGGAIAFLYALKYPDDLAGIVSVGSGARLRVHPMFLEELEKAIDEPGPLREVPGHRLGARRAGAGPGREEARHRERPGGDAERPAGLRRLRHHGSAGRNQRSHPGPLRQRRHHDPAEVLASPGGEASRGPSRRHPTAEPTWSSPRSPKR